mmetsp:Transcript_915/g.1863  ORF Transcript_915/g.1863 Transcript_915/m.1863 type:complete len:87 (-) Transcript_915:28-288(-)
MLVPSQISPLAFLSPPPPAPLPPITYTEVYVHTQKGMCTHKVQSEDASAVCTFQSTTWQCREYRRSAEQQRDSRVQNPCQLQWKMI